MRGVSLFVVLLLAVAVAAETVEWDLSRAGIGGELQQNGSYSADGVTVRVGQGSATAMPSFFSSYASFKAGNTLQVSTATGNITEVYLVKNASSAAAVSDVTASVGSITAIDYNGGSAAHWTGKAPSVREYDYDEAAAHVRDLERLAADGDIPELIRLMKAIVPEFKSNNSPFEQFDQQQSTNSESTN